MEKDFSLNQWRSLSQTKSKFRIPALFLFGFLFGIGLVSLILLCVYALSTVIYTFSGAQCCGDIALVPKWIFCFSIFVLLGKTKILKSVVE